MTTPPLIPASREKIEETFLRAYEFLKGKPESSDIGDTVTKYSESFQDFMKTFLSGKGIITQETLDDIDEQLRLAKKKKLEQEAKNTFVTYGIYVSTAILLIGAVWFFTRKKTTNGQ